MHLRISLKNAQHECHEDLIIVALLCGLISCLKHKKTFLKPFHSFQFFFPEKIAFSFPNRLNSVTWENGAFIPSPPPC